MSRSRPTSTVQIESDEEEVVDPEEQWPTHARYNPTGALRVQNVFLRTVCHDAIKVVEKALVTEHAWPELHRAAAYKRQVLLVAAERLVAKDKRYKDLVRRIKEDDDFVKNTGKWVCLLFISCLPLVMHGFHRWLIACLTIEESYGVWLLITSPSSNSVSVTSARRTSTP